MGCTCSLLLLLSLNFLKSEFQLFPLVVKSWPEVTDNDSRFQLRLRVWVFCFRAFAFYILGMLRFRAFGCVVSSFFFYFCFWTGVSFSRFWCFVSSFLTGVSFFGFWVIFLLWVSYALFSILRCLVLIFEYGLCFLALCPVLLAWPGCKLTHQQMQDFLSRIYFCYIIEPSM